MNRKELPLSGTARTSCALVRPSKEDVKAGWPIAAAEKNSHRLFTVYHSIIIMTVLNCLALDIKTPNFISMRSVDELIDRIM